jgi:hypothetical protein
MKDSPAQPLRGDAAWRASVKEIAKRNSAAQAEGARKRAEKVAAADREAVKMARREARDLPRQPGRD